ncbi:hypothetical protein [Streptomyces sp. DH37]|uniref:hypothetical protein n=1 Tax=Streptomyces sp. DH37 TaxID=3040122 RepID=UPI0024421C1E|nr:hypothetical protein [Streptomyces sp. DH37]MDG9703759.1 hypothetical protein [Streptomyces sp. DH37]
MICDRCAYAADRGLPPIAHCGSQPGPGAQCCCQHRPPRQDKPKTAPKKES